MSVIIHFLNGNDPSIQNHYLEKEYRNDIIIEICGKFYEVYFFVKDALEYEMRKEGFFSLPGIIILDEITNDKIYSAISILVKLKYFDSFLGHSEFLLHSSFADNWYQKNSSIFTLENMSHHMLER